MRLLLCLVLPCACAATPIGLDGDRVVSRYKGTPLAVAESTGAALERAKAAARSHTVEPGETVWRIARTYGVSADSLMTANGLTDARQLRVGKALTIPGGAPAPPPAAASAPAASTSARYPLKWPVEGQITSRFGSRWGRAHDGIDIGAPLGTEVQAAADGEVLFSDRHGTYGNLVVVKHDDGLVTVYAHHQMNLVRKGQRVRVGQAIAKVGQSGRASGPHLHFEVRRGVRPDNPLRYLPP